MRFDPGPPSLPRRSGLLRSATPRSESVSLLQEGRVGGSKGVLVFAAVESTALLVMSVICLPSRER